MAMFDRKRKGSTRPRNRTKSSASWNVQGTDKLRSLLRLSWLNPSSERISGHYFHLWTLPSIYLALVLLVELRSDWLPWQINAAIFMTFAFLYGRTWELTKTHLKKRVFGLLVKQVEISSIYSFKTIEVWPSKRPMADTLVLELKSGKLVIMGFQSPSLDELSRTLMARLPDDARFSEGRAIKRFRIFIKLCHWVLLGLVIALVLFMFLTLFTHSFR